MIENTETEYHIKALRKKIEMFYPEQFRLQAGLAGKSVEDFERIVMLDIRFETENKVRLLRIHPKHVIAIIAADISDDLSGEIRHLRDHSVPFFLASPFGINVDSKYGKRSLSPRHKSAEDLVDPLLIVGF